MITLSMPHRTGRSGCAMIISRAAAAPESNGPAARPARDRITPSDWRWSAPASGSPAWARSAPPGRGPRGRGSHCRCRRRHRPAGTGSRSCRQTRLSRPGCGPGWRPWASGARNRPAASDRPGPPSGARCCGPRWRHGHGRESRRLRSRAGRSRREPQDLFGGGAVVVLDDGRHCFRSGCRGRHRGHRAAPAGSAGMTGWLMVMRRPRVTSHSASRNSPMKVTVETSVQEPWASRTPMLS